MEHVLGNLPMFLDEQPLAFKVMAQCGHDTELSPKTCCEVAGEKHHSQHHPSPPSMPPQPPLTSPPLPNGSWDWTRKCQVQALLQGPLHPRNQGNGEPGAVPLFLPFFLPFICPFFLPAICHSLLASPFLPSFKVLIQFEDTAAVSDREI